MLIDLKLFERLLPPSPVLAGRWSLYLCRRCGARTQLDDRVWGLPMVGSLHRRGLAVLRCARCRSSDVQRFAMVVS